MENKLVAGIVAAAIAVIVLAGVLMPALSNATTTETTFKNEGYGRYSDIGSSADNEITISWDHTDPTVFIVDGVEIKYDMPSNLGGISVVFGTDFSVRLIYGSNGYGVQYIGPSNSDYLLTSEQNGLDMTISLNQGTITLTDTNTTPTVKTLSYTTAYYPNPNGQYSMKDSSEAAYLLKDSSFMIANGMTGSAGIYFIGTVDDGVTISLYRVTGTTDNVVMNYTDDPNYVGLVELSNITFDITVSGNTTSATYSYFLVPYEVTAEKAVHLTDAMNVILSVIPIIIIVAVLLGVVAIFIIRRE